MLRGKLEEGGEVNSTTPEQAYQQTNYKTKHTQNTFHNCASKMLRPYPSYIPTSYI